jgi:hypothetical protein
VTHGGAALALVGKLEVEADGDPLDVARQLQRLAGEHDRGARVGHLLRQLAQRAADFRLAEVGAEVLEEIDRVAGHPGDVLQRAEGVLRVADGHAVAAAEAARHRPLEERLLQRGRDLRDDRTHALLLHRLHGDQRVERAHQRLEVVHGLAVGHEETPKLPRNPLPLRNVHGPARVEY